MIAIEVKAGRRFKPDMLKGLDAVGELRGIARRILVYGGADSWRHEGIDVMSVARFVAEVARGL